MTEQEFLDHYGLTRNPFSDGDAQTDAVFQQYCIESTYHPAWSKVYGDPTVPATSIVLGSKGAGKTAMRLQIIKQLGQHNLENPTKKVFYVQYDDFNSYLGRLQQSASPRIRENPDKVLQLLQVWDHIDAILCEATTKLIDKTLQPAAQSDQDISLIVDPGKLNQLTRGQKRDFMLLATCYDQSKTGTFTSRWNALKSKIGYSNWNSWKNTLIGLVGSLLVGLIGYGLGRYQAFSKRTLIYLIVSGLLIAWIPYLVSTVKNFYLASRIQKYVRIGRRDFGYLGRALMKFPAAELDAQPTPTANRSDDRYALLDKLQSILKTLGFEGLIVVVDRIDEPDLVNGKSERMKSLVWPMLDNKLLKHPGLGIKLLLPSELQYHLDREDIDFNQRARLDKQNLISNFNWTGEALYDVVSARMSACSKPGTNPVSTPNDLFETTITGARLISAMHSLRTPRSLFSFLYLVVSEHCKRFRSTESNFKNFKRSFRIDSGGISKQRRQTNRQLMTCST